LCASHLQLPRADEKFRDFWSQFSDCDDMRNDMPTRGTMNVPRSSTDSMITLAQ
jgi:hypothetical protein